VSVGCPILECCNAVLHAHYLIYYAITTPFLCVDLGIYMEIYIPRKSQNP